MLRRRVAAAGVVLALIVGAAACSDADDTGGSGEKAPSVTSGRVAAEAPAPGSSLSPADFGAAAQLPGTVLVDVRTPEEYAEGHLEGAVLIDLQDEAAFLDRLAALDPAGSYAIYCRTGNRSAAAMEHFEQAGFGSYYDLAGGITSWTDDGGAVVTD
jgi:rhodanese-related sulfurtransferase